MEARLRIGLALCMAGAVAWVVSTSFWGVRLFGLVDAHAAQSTFVSAWWIGLQAFAVGAALVAASRVGRSAWLFGWGATVAFVVALFLQTASSALSVASTHASQAAEAATTCMRATAWLGTALLVVLLGRIGASGGRWARSIGEWGVVIVPACAAVEQVAWLSLSGDAARYGVAVAERLVLPLLVGTLVVAAWRGAAVASTDSRRSSLVDAVVAFPGLLAARCGLAFATGLVASPLDELAEGDRGAERRPRVPLLPDALRDERRRNRVSQPQRCPNRRALARVCARAMTHMGLIEHMEQHCGPIVGGSAEDADGNKAPFQVVQMRRAPVLWRG